jgi:hypothetical protein
MPPSPEVGANFHRKFYIFLLPVRRHRYKTIVMGGAAITILWTSTLIPIT